MLEKFEVQVKDGELERLGNLRPSGRATESC